MKLFDLDKPITQGLTTATSLVWGSSFILIEKRALKVLIIYKWILRIGQSRYFFLLPIAIKNIVK